jgi:AraC family transcriptional regulator
MIKVKIVEKNAFLVCVKKIWITGQHNEEFGEFWDKSHKTGLVDLLKEISNPKEMEPAVMGISRVEKDPNNRAFYFYICSETEALSTTYEDMESFEVPAAKWAVFSNVSNNDNLAEALIKAEMY